MVGVVVKGKDSNSIEVFGCNGVYCVGSFKLIVVSIGVYVVEDVVFVVVCNFDFYVLGGLC